MISRLIPAGESILTLGKMKNLFLTKSSFQRNIHRVLNFEQHFWQMFYIVFAIQSSSEVQIDTKQHQILYSY